MFLGHYAVALAAKRAAPNTSLGMMVFASQFMDLLWPILILVGAEEVRIDPGNTAVTPLEFVYYPFTHSLMYVVVWGMLLGVIYHRVTNSVSGGIVLASLTASHWVLDFITHRPDLLLVPDVDMKAGLGLWNSLAGTIIVEGGLFVAAVWFYLRSTTATDRIGVTAFWWFVGTLVIIWTLNLFGPPPPSVETIGIVGNAGWLLVFWAYWIDRHRKSNYVPPPREKKPRFM